MKKLNIVFMGTPDFSVPSLDLLANHPQVESLQVISMPDRPAGRGKNLKSPEVIEYAKSKKLNYFQTKNINREEDFLTSLESQNIDVIIVLAFAQFLGKRVLELPRLGCFNIHTSLLPKYRGAAPIQYALLNGDTSTGVSIQRMVKKMDAGDICHSHPVSIGEFETGGQLYTRLKYQASLSLNLFLEDLLNEELIFTSQNEDEVSFAPTLKREDGKIDLNSSREKTFNQVKALYPWPGTHCYLDGKKLKVLETQKIKDSQLSKESKFLTLKFNDGLLRLSRVQLEGKKACSDSGLLNGYRGEGVLS